MPVSDAQYDAWLETPDKIRTLLVEIGYVDGGTPGTIYVSTHNFISGSSDDPANQPYDDFVELDLSYRRSLSEVFVGRSTISRGEVRIALVDEAMEYLDYYFDKQAIAIYLGDPSWEKADFRQIMSGVVKNRQVTRSHIIFSIRDDAELLEQPFAMSTVESGPSRGQVVPLCFGEVFNVSPVLIDPADDTYQVHDGPIEDILAVRDNGLDVTGFTKDIVNGQFSLDVPASGTLTVDVKGAKPTTGFTGYQPRAYQMVRQILTNYSDIPAEQIDTTGLTAMNTAFPCECGLYISNDGYTIIQAIDDIIRSVAGYWHFNKSGVFTVGSLFDSAGAGSTINLGADDIEEFGVSVRREVAPKTSVRIGYKRNWTVQQANGLADTVTTEAFDLLSTEFSIAEYEDASVATSYPDSERGVENGGLVALEVFARAIARLLGGLELKKHTVYEVASFGPSFKVNLGDTVNVTYPLLGFEDGVATTVVGVNDAPGQDRSLLSLLVIGD